MKAFITRTGKQIMRKVHMAALAFTCIALAACQSDCENDLYDDAKTVSASDSSEPWFDEIPQAEPQSLQDNPGAGSNMIEDTFLCDTACDLQDKQYGTVKPSLSSNGYTEVVLSKADRMEDRLITHTYAADFDSDGKQEAFVIIGELSDEWGDSALEMSQGELWFVNSSYTASRLIASTTFRAWQQYISQDGKIYFFVDYNLGFTSNGTLVLSVRGDQLMIFPLYGDTIIIDPTDIRQLDLAGCARSLKNVNDDGQVIVTHDCYDNTCQIIDPDEGKHLWTGHTWKPYTFEFDHEQWIETPAREVTREELEAVAALPETFDESAFDGVQYILRENGELNINMATINLEYQSIEFGNITFCLGETQEWIAQERDNNGIYSVQLTGESHWDYLEHLDALLTGTK